MKILLVNTTLHTGGASIACERLMKALVAHGHEVRLVVRDDLRSDAPLFKRCLAKARFCWERLMLLRDIPYSRVFSIDDGRCGTDIAATADFEWADVVHLHWVNQAMLGLDDIEHLVRRCRETGKRLVWTMHDIWAATGVCHLPGNCERWQTGCGHCPLLRRGSTNDLSARTYEHKRQAYAKGSIHFVACSDYLASTAKKSPLLAQHTVTTIPNPIDTDFYSPESIGTKTGFNDSTTPSATVPADKRALRSRLGLPADKRLVLFVAYNVNDENKGFHRVQQAIAHLVFCDASQKNTLAVIPVGKNASAWKERMACEVVPFEYVAEATMMRDLYRACDVLVVASKMENLPNTIAEAKACGLPVVATRVGGIPEMIRHGIDGYLATPPSSKSTSASEGSTTDETTTALAAGLLWALTPSGYEERCTAARDHAVDTYGETAVVARFEELYRKE